MDAYIESIEKKFKNMNFGDALKAMHYGQKVQRAGWNGKGMFIFQIAGDAWNFETDIEGVDEIPTEPFLCMKTASDSLIPWLASQADIQAEDWEPFDFMWQAPWEKNPRSFRKGFPGCRKIRAKRKTRNKMAKQSRRANSR